MKNPRFLDLADILEIHQSRITLYGGTYGIRDLGMLQSALAQPQAGMNGEFLHKDLYEMAAAYLFHIARNHPFLDGNKRTALAVCLVFLDFNGIEIDANLDELESITVDVSAGKATKEDAAAFLKRCGHKS